MYVFRDGTKTTSKDLGLKFDNNNGGWDYLSTIIGYAYSAMRLKMVLEEISQCTPEQKEILKVALQ